MPLGLWKSKWEIHREDMTRFWAEMDRRHEEVQAQLDHDREDSDRRHEEVQAQIDRDRDESDRRQAEFRAQMDRRDREFEEEKARRDRESEEEKSRLAVLDAEYRKERSEERAESDRRWTELRKKSDALREDYDRELTESRQFNREILLRMEKAYAEVNATLIYIGEELVELKAAVNAQTEAILKLVDRFEEWERRQAA